MEKALGEGFEFVQVGRAIIRDPDFVKHLQTGEVTVSDRDHCNRCIASMDAAGVLCDVWTAAAEGAGFWMMPATLEKVTIENSEHFS